MCDCSNIEYPGYELCVCGHITRTTHVESALDYCIDVTQHYFYVYPLVVKINSCLAITFYSSSDFPHSIQESPTQRQGRNVKDLVQIVTFSKLRQLLNIGVELSQAQDAEESSHDVMSEIYYSANSQHAEEA